MKNEKLIKAQETILRKVENIIRGKGFTTKRVKDKIRIERENRLSYEQPNLCTSACLSICKENEVLGFMRYKRYHNKKTFKFGKGVFILSDKNDRQIKIYDNSHNKDWHSHDINLSNIKINETKCNGNIDEIINECLEKLQIRSY